MSDKAEMIKKMIEMQKKFVEYEHQNGLDPEDYFAPASGHDLDGFRQEYRDTAMKVVELAHEQVGSKR